MMKGRLAFLAVFSILALLVAAPAYAQKGPAPRAPPENIPEPPDSDPPEPPEDPGEEPPPPEEVGPPDESGVATLNVSFPTIHTTIIDFFYQQECGLDQESGNIECVVVLDEDGLPIPLEVTEEFNTTYAEYNEAVDDLGLFFENLLNRLGEPILHSEYVLGADGCPLDVDPADGEPDVVEMPLADWDALTPPEDWYPQPKIIQDVSCLVCFDQETGAAVPPASAIDPATGDPIAGFVCAPDPNKIWVASCVWPSNAWQADWFRLDPDQPITDYPDPVVYVEFADIADVLESSPEWEVGKRVPYAIALYDRVLASYFIDPEELDPVFAALTSYDMSLLENSGGDAELFGTADTWDDMYDGDLVIDTRTGEFTTDIAFASVLTTKFEAFVQEPDSSLHLLKLVPMIGPNGNITLKVGGMGFIPEQVGEHIIMVHFNDPLIDLQDAEINNLSYYVLPTGCQADVQDWLKADKEWIAGNSVYVKFNVVENRSGGTEPPVDEAGGNGGSGGNGGGNGTHSDSVKGRK